MRRIFFWSVSYAGMWIRLALIAIVLALVHAHGVA
jgi:hypothetical protein